MVDALSARDGARDPSRGPGNRSRGLRGEDGGSLDKSGPIAQAGRPGPTDSAPTSAPLRDRGRVVHGTGIALPAEDSGPRRAR